MLDNNEHIIYVKLILAKSFKHLNLMVSVMHVVNGLEIGNICINYTIHPIVWKVVRCEYGNS